MKVSPISQGGMPGVSIGNASTGRTDPDRIERAKAVASGENPMRLAPSDTPVDPQMTRAQETLRKIRMNTQASTNRHELDIPREPAGNPDPAAQEPAAPAQSATNDANEQVQGSEDTKPLSPQFAALRKQQRALQVKEREIAEKEKALEAKATQGGGVDLGRLKSDPLGVLQEAGVTYEQLTEAILSGQSANPAAAQIAALEAKIQALETGVDQKLTDRDAQAEQQVLAEMSREADRLIASGGEQFEMVKSTNSRPMVIDLIHRTYKQTGEVLDVTEALQLVEDELLNEHLEIARLNKIQSRINQTQGAAPMQTQTQRPQGMRTLTNRDTARPMISRRDRMIAAFEGRLKK